MIVDTSAIVAIFRGEQGSSALFDVLTKSETTEIAAPNLVELYAVIDRGVAPEQRRRLDALLELLEIRVAPFTEEHARLAREAYRDFGRGSGHAAGLNLGDCFSYALAVERDTTLLFAGQDFVHTDVRPALER